MRRKRCFISLLALVLAFAGAAYGKEMDKSAPSITSFTNDGIDTTISWEEPDWEGVDKIEIRIDRVDGSDSIKNPKKKYQRKINASDDDEMEIEINKKGYYAARVRAYDVNGDYTNWSDFSSSICITSDDISESSESGPYIYRGNGPGFNIGGPGFNTVTPGNIISNNGNSCGYGPGYNSCTNLDDSFNQLKPGNSAYGYSSTVLTQKKANMNVYRNHGWQSDSNGKWYLNSSGYYPVSTWVLFGDTYYHFDENGYMDTNRWILGLDNKWYFCKVDGKMAKGWNNINEEWYYMSASGAMYDEGIHLIDGKYYYMKAGGSILRDGWYNGFYYDMDGVRIN